MTNLKPRLVNLVLATLLAATLAGCATTTAQPEPGNKRPAGSICRPSDPYCVRLTPADVERMRNTGEWPLVPSQQ